MGRYDADKERFLESSDRFQQAMLVAIKAHQEGVVRFLDTLSRVEEREDQLQESIDELKRLILEHGQQLREQGQQLREQGQEIRDLRTRLNGGA